MNFRDQVREYAQVEGKTVLDLGGYDGEQCKWALDKGAIRAICVDNEQWEAYQWSKPQMYPGVVYKNMDFMHYSDPADVVIFQNVIYHQKNPYQVLEKVRTLTKNQMIISTSIVEGDEAMWRIYRPYEGHPVSWTVMWRPTVKGLLALLENVGFKVLAFNYDPADHMVVNCAP